MIDGLLYRNEVLDYIFFYGLLGIGKIILVFLIGNELNKKVYYL